MKPSSKLLLMPLLCLAIAAGALCLPSTVLAEQNTDWSANDRIEFSDFTGEVPENTEFDAMTKSGIEASWTFDPDTQETQGDNIVVTVVVTNVTTKSFFTPGQSWVKDGARDNKKLLAHERGHFDLTELVRTSQEVQAIITNVRTNGVSVTVPADSSVQQILDAINNKLNEEINVTIKAVLDREQESYDDETNHGQNDEKQKEWIEKFVDGLGLDDKDFDGYFEENEDNCPGTNNPDQQDSNGDTVGDACAKVGGLAAVDLNADAPRIPLDTAQSSGTSVGVLAGTIAGMAALAVTLTGAAWYARRRWLR